MTTTNGAERELPPLPVPHWARDCHGEAEVYLAEDMHAYARLAVSEALAARATPDAAGDALTKEQVNRCYALQAAGSASYAIQQAMREGLRMGLAAPRPVGEADARDAALGEHADIERAIASTLNCHSAENGSNTPDFILAHLLRKVLHAFDSAVMRREEWYGREGRAAMKDTREVTK